MIRFEVEERRREDYFGQEFNDSFVSSLRAKVQAVKGTKKHAAKNLQVKITDFQIDKKFTNRFNSFFSLQNLLRKRY